MGKVSCTMLVIAGCSENKIFEPNDMVTETDAGYDLGAGIGFDVGADSGTTESEVTGPRPTDSVTTDTGTDGGAAVTTSAIGNANCAHSERGVVQPAWRNSCRQS